MSTLEGQCVRKKLSGERTDQVNLPMSSLVKVYLVELQIPVADISSADKECDIQ